MNTFEDATSWRRAITSYNKHSRCWRSRRKSHRRPNRTCNWYWRRKNTLTITLLEGVCLHEGRQRMQMIRERAFSKKMEFSALISICFSQMPRRIFVCQLGHKQRRKTTTTRCHHRCWEIVPILSTPNKIHDNKSQLLRRISDMSSTAPRRNSLANLRRAAKNMSSSDARKTNLNESNSSSTCTPPSRCASP